MLARVALLLGVLFVTALAASGITTSLVILALRRGWISLKAR